MIHPQLLPKCHYFFKLGQSHVLLHRNAIIPCLVLIPETDVADLLDLPWEQRNEVMQEAAVMARFLQQYWNLTKINFAQIGNVVPQMHLLIAGRVPGDACWPNPIWGHLKESSEYTQAEVMQIQHQLRNVLEAAGHRVISGSIED